MDSNRLENLTGFQRKALAELLNKVESDTPLRLPAFSRISSLTAAAVCMPPNILKGFQDLADARRDAEVRAHFDRIVIDDRWSDDRIATLADVKPQVQRIPKIKRWP